jgi:hypothetical protein
MLLCFNQLNSSLVLRPRGSSWMAFSEWSTGYWNIVMTNRSDCEMLELGYNFTRRLEGGRAYEHLAVNPCPARCLPLVHDQVDPRIRRL